MFDRLQWLEMYFTSPYIGICASHCNVRTFNFVTYDCINALECGRLIILRYNVHFDGIKI
jgi:hypothetical protein